MEFIFTEIYFAIDETSLLAHKLISDNDKSNANNFTL